MSSLPFRCRPSTVSIEVDVSVPASPGLSAEMSHRRLVALVRGRSRSRLGLGRAVDALARKSGHHEMGFSSVKAYALQRTGLSARFVEESRAMARRLFEAPGLPLLAHALGHGRVSWSAAARVSRVLVRRAKEGHDSLASEEGHAVEAASSMTVRNLERWLVALGGDETLAAALERTLEPEREPPDLLLLERSVDAADQGMLEATRALVEFMDGQVSDSGFVDALLAEAMNAMADGTVFEQALRSETHRRDWLAAHSDELGSLAQARALARESAADATDARVRRLRAARGQPHRDDDDAPIEWEPLEGWPIAELDARIRHLSRQLRDQDLAIADAALAVKAARAWRRLGWSSQEAYAREELGMSGSSLRAIVARARRMLELPELRDAVAAGRLGLEAAGAIGRVATSDTVEDWVQRAGRRTFVHLREELRAVGLLERHGAPTVLGPPAEAQLEQVRDFERSVASGAWFETLMASVGGQDQIEAEDPDRQMCGGPGTDRQMCGGPDLDPGKRVTPRLAALVFAGAPGPASERLRLRISDEQAGWWRYLERAYLARERQLQRAGAEPLSFVAFACLAVWMSWYPAVKQTGEYDRWTSVYVRDRYQCSSPVCSRRDVTPHHLRFQSQGGGHEDENVAALCSWCHLEGIHGGRIKATPPASAIHWRLGRQGDIEVRGRELRSAGAV